MIISQSKNRNNKYNRMNEAPVKFYSKSYSSEQAYVNGRHVKDIELAKTQNNQFVQVKGHINDRPVFYQNYPPLQWATRGMTALRSRRKRRKHKKTAKNPKPDTSLHKRK